MMLRRSEMVSNTTSRSVLVLLSRAVSVVSRSPCRICSSRINWLALQAKSTSTSSV